MADLVLAIFGLPTFDTASGPAFQNLNQDGGS
jgi:hypothetical protein